MMRGCVTGPERPRRLGLPATRCKRRLRAAKRFVAADGRAVLSINVVARPGERSATRRTEALTRSDVRGRLPAMSVPTRRKKGKSKSRNTRRSARRAVRPALFDILGLDAADVCDCPACSGADFDLG